MCLWMPPAFHWRTLITSWVGVFAGWGRGTSAVTLLREPCSTLHGLQFQSGFLLTCCLSLGVLPMHWMWKLPLQVAHCLRGAFRLIFLLQSLHWEAGSSALVSTGVSEVPCPQAQHFHWLLLPPEHFRWATNDLHSWQVFRGPSVLIVAWQQSHFAFANGSSSNVKAVSSTGVAVRQGVQLHDSLVASLFLKALGTSPHW